MKMMRSLIGGLAAIGIVAVSGCSGGDESTAPAVESDAESAPSAPTAPDAASETPTTDSTNTLDGSLLADFTGDAAAGNAVFAQCRACHVIDEGVNRLGPSLYNILGREAGTVEGFNYSDANANSSIIWTTEKLFQFLEDPRRVIPDTRMVYRGLSDPQDRANLIAYLDAQWAVSGSF